MSTYYGDCSIFKATKQLTAYLQLKMKVKLMKKLSKCFRIAPLKQCSPSKPFWYLS